MKQFMDLREFMMLKDPLYKKKSDERSVHRNEVFDWRKGLSNAEDVLMRYDIAKASWEKYGDEGPPFGSKVQTLHSGHGGGPGVIATLAGIFDRDKRFFLLTRKERDSFHKEREGQSIVERTQWWVHIKVIEEKQNE